MLSNEAYEAAFLASPDGCLLVGEDGTIRGVNPRAEALFGYRADELVGRSVDLLVPDAVRDTHASDRARYIAAPRNRPMGVGLDLRAVHKDGTLFPVEISLSPWRAEDGGVTVVCTVRDVTESRRLRDFSERALLAAEDERTRIARELHDDTAQRLATLVLRVREVADEADEEGRRRVLEQLRAELVETAEGIKRMARGLRPPEIADLGLSAAVQAHVRRMSQDRRVDIALDVEPGVALGDPAAELAVYRIVQEALANACRHGGGIGVRVSLRHQDGVLSAEVSDEGPGFVPGEISKGGRGLGLIGMQERATIIGATLRVDTRPGQGTRVTLSIPFSKEARS